MTSSSFALSFSFFSLFLGVATPALLAAFCRLEVAALGGGGGDLSRSRSFGGCFSGRSVEEFAGEDLADLLGYGGVVDGAGGLRSLAVFDRPRDCDWGLDGGNRWDVDRSRAGEAVLGGAGAGRYAVGAAAFFGGGGGAR